jgi:hypothetical protein
VQTEHALSEVLGSHSHLIRSDRRPCYHQRFSIFCRAGQLYPSRCAPRLHISFDDISPTHGRRSVIIQFANCGFVQLRSTSCFENSSLDRSQAERECYYSWSGLFNAVSLTFVPRSSLSLTQPIYFRVKYRRFILVNYVLINKPGSLVRSKKISPAVNHLINSEECLLPRPPFRDHYLI